MRRNTHHSTIRCTWAQGRGGGATNVKGRLCECIAVSMTGKAGPRRDDLAVCGARYFILSSISSFTYSRGQHLLRLALLLWFTSLPDQVLDMR